MAKITAKRIGRRILKIFDKINRHTAVSDRLYSHEDVPMSNLVSHSNFMQFVIEKGNREGLRVLEIGSREVTAPLGIKKFFNKAEYIGFDYYPGANVDVVGDAHKLSEYFDEPFDLVYSSAVFEHLAMPWIVATEIAKILKVGGTLAIETHFSFSSHERPWHFFHYTDMALKALFSPALGFKCIEAGFSNPVVGRFSNQADAHLKGKKVTGLYCHSEYLGEKVEDIQNFDWKNVELDNVVADSRYPAPK